ncbi:MAG TPA: cation:proton antiporter, partial [Candidatus Thermoplasmatota archaeon]|nr:cation:proton antiporter [Candidatus Thermoplasmatota archaeon]
DLTIIRDLAVILVTAGATALVFHKLRLPLVLGYLAVGVLVGPHTPPFSFIADPGNVGVLAQLGILFLLFSLGLHFHLGQLKRVGGLALSAGALEVAIMVGVGFLAGRLFGWHTADSLFLGAILAISSTTMIVKVLGEMGQLRAPTTQAIFGILLVEDLVAVLLIALLSSIALTGTVTAGALGDVLVRVAIFGLTTLVIGLVVVPRLVDHVARLKVEEVLVLLAVGVAFAVSMIADALGLSIAMGAFIAGAIVAESKASATVERRIAPLRDVFAAVFFVSTGALLDPADVVAHWPAILALGAVCIAGKILAVGFATFVAGYPPEQALRVGIGMAMIGEFSFVIATLGRDYEVTSGFLFPVAVAVSALTALVTPLLMRHSDAIVRGLARVAPARLAGFGRMYHAWVGGARRTERGEEAFAGGYEKGAILRVFAYSAVLLAIGLGARVAEPHVVAAYGDTLVVPGDVRILLYALAALLGLPFLLALARAVRRLVDGLVRVVIPPRASDAARGAAAADVLRRSIYVFLSVVASTVAFAAGVAFLPPLPLLAGAAVVVAVAAFLLRGALRRLDKQLEGAVDTVVGPGGGDEARDEVLAAMRERYPWDLHVETILVPVGSRAADKRIRDLLLPQRTGANILTHERAGRRLVNPPPDTLLHPGDAVGLLGEREQVESARRYLLAEAQADAAGAVEHDTGVQIEELDVVEGSPISGLTLAGSRLRELTGASIVGLRRDGVPILNPAPVLRLRPGDAVVVIGSPSQIEGARALFRPVTPG